jgi:hypothetical protein
MAVPASQGDLDDVDERRPRRCDACEAESVRRGFRRSPLWGDGNPSLPPEMRRVSAARWCVTLAFGKQCRHAISALEDVWGADARPPILADCRRKP